MPSFPSRLGALAFVGCNLNEDCEIDAVRFQQEGQEEQLGGDLGLVAPCCNY